MKEDLRQWSEQLSWQLRWLQKVEEPKLVSPEWVREATLELQQFYGDLVPEAELEDLVRAVAVPPPERRTLCDLSTFRWAIAQPPKVALAASIEALNTLCRMLKADPGQVQLKLVRTLAGTIPLIVKNATGKSKVLADSAEQNLALVEQVTFLLGTLGEAITPPMDKVGPYQRLLFWAISTINPAKKPSGCAGNELLDAALTQVSAPGLYGLGFEFHQKVRALKGRPVALREYDAWSFEVTNFLSREGRSLGPELWEQILHLCKGRNTKQSLAAFGQLVRAKVSVHEWAAFQMDARSLLDLAFQEHGLPDYMAEWSFEDYGGFKLLSPSRPQGENGKALAGLVWAVALEPDVAAVTSIGRVAVAAFEKPKGTGTLSKWVGTAAMDALSAIGSPAAKAALKRARISAGK